MRLFEVVVSILVGGFAVAFAMSIFVEEAALSLQVLVVLVLLLLAFIVIKHWNSSGATIKYKRVLPPLKDEKPLNTTDLNKILTLLEKYQYSGKSYYRLGLLLGLFDRTLDVIKANNNNSIEDCLREVLTKWLEKADNVEKPTWSALVAALRSMNHNAVAEGIDRETDPVSMIIENHRHALSQSIPENRLTYIARLLSYELDIKSLESLHGPTSEKIEVLLTTVKNAVYENYESILKFTDVLCNFPAVGSIGNSIQKDYSKTIVDNNIEVKTMGRNGDPIKVPRNFSLECKKMRNKWAIALDSAIKVIAVDVQELKGFLQIQTSNSDIKEKLNACQSKGDVMQIIIDNCSLVDLTLLEGIIERFNIKEAKKHIDEYKEIKDDFCKKIPLRSWLNEAIGYPSSLQCETLQLSVDKSVDERTLKDVQDIIAIAFESFAPNVRVVVIKEGNSFTITCSFPLALSESLIATALKNLEQLKKEGLIKLTIGYSTVYSQNKAKVATVEKFKKLILSPITSTWSTRLEKKSQYITSVYNSSGTMKQLLVSLTVQSINSEASSNEEKKMLQEENTTLVKKLVQDDTIQELKQAEIKALQERENIAAEDKKKLNEKIKTLLSISRTKDQEIKDLKAAAIKQKEEMMKTEKDYELQIQPLKIAMKKKDEKNIELQHLDEMAHLEKSRDSDNSSHLRWGPKEIMEHDHGFTEITNPSLKACQNVITELKIEKNNQYLLKELSPGAAQLLIPTLLNARNVTVLGIQNTPLTSDFILLLSSQLSSNRSIWNLGFYHNTIDDNGVIELVHSLKDNTRVTHLSVAYNSGITSVSVQPLKELILTNKTLATLIIFNTNIDTDGVLSLTETLTMNKKIAVWIDDKYKQVCSSLPYYDAIKERLQFLVIFAI